MPKVIYIPEDADRSGIEVTWTPSAQRLDFSGWYDSCVGIQNTSMQLREFFEIMGITEKDCKKAFDELKSRYLIL